MIMFFLNKPVSIYPYLAGLVAIFAWFFIICNFTKSDEPFLTLMVDLFAFSFWYYIFLIRYYIFGGEELIFFNVPLTRFKRLFNFCLTLYGSLILGANLTMLKVTNSFIIAFFFAVISVITLFIFERLVVAKFISEGFKSNFSIKGVNLDDIYQELREVAIKKLIKSKKHC